MKKTVTVILALLLVTASCVFAVSADETVTPTAYWDFVDAFPDDSNAANFMVDGEYRYSSDGHLLLAAKEGDGDTDHLQIFINKEDKGGTSMKDNDVVVARFRFSDNTYAKDYRPNFGYIGVNPSAGNETYVTPQYINTYDWQVMYFDCQDDSWAVDAWYIVWFWFKDARFPFEIELDYIATFPDMDKAQAYVASRGHDSEPTIITEPESETTEPAATEPKPDVSQHTAAPGTGAESETAPASGTAGQQENNGGNKWVVPVVIVVVVAAAAVVIIIVKKKSK